MSSSDITGRGGAPGGPGLAREDLLALAPLFERLPDPLVVLDAAGAVLIANQLALDAIGWTLGQLTGAEPEPPRRTLVDAHGVPCAFEALPLGRTLRTGEPCVDELIGLDDGVTTTWFLVSGRAVRDADDAISGVILSFRDATEVVTARSIDRGTRDLATGLVEIELGQLDAVIDGHLRTLGETARADRTLFVAIDREAGRAGTSHDWARDGTALEKIPGGVPLDLMAPLLGFVARRRPVVLVDRGQLSEPTAASSRLAAWGLVAAVAAPVMIAETLEGLLVVGWNHPFQPARAVVDFAVVAADLLAARLERERSHQALTELTADLELRDAGGPIGQSLAVDVVHPDAALSDLVIELDPEDRLVAVHESAENALPSLASFVGTPIVEFFDPARRAELAEALGTLRETGAPQRFVFEWIIQGNSHTFECRLVDRPGGGAIAMVRDSTEMKALAARVDAQAAELRDARDEVAELVRARDEFLASVSHELRTPLNAILGMAEMLLDDRDPPLAEPHATLVGTIDFSGRRLRSLIDDLLELSGLRAHLVELAAAPVELSALCRAAIEAVTPRARTNDLSVEVLLVPGEVVVTGDGGHLRQVVDRLLDNAVTFTEPGGSIGLHLSRPDPDHLALAVWDSGPGIAEGDLERIFEPFTQLDGGLDRLRPGPGLGLAIVRQLVELHGGRIEVDSTPGQGSRFTVVLPAGR